MNTYNEAFSKLSFFSLFVCTGFPFLFQPSKTNAYRTDEPSCFDLIMCANDPHSLKSLISIRTNLLMRPYRATPPRDL